MTPRPGDPDRVPPDPEERDPGLFRERTELAWHRTGIAFAALGGAVLKTAPVAGLIILASSTPIFVLAHASRRGHRADGARQRRSLLLVTIAVTVVSLVALVLALVAGDPGSQGHDSAVIGGATVLGAGPGTA